MRNSADGRTQSLAVQLDTIERHILAAEDDIDRQKDLIAELRRDGHSTHVAESLLDIFCETLRSHEQSLAVFHQSVLQP